MAATVNNDPLTFRPLKIGAGGWVTGHDQHTDGTLVCRTDVGGGYLWSGSVWSQIITTNSMPAGDVHQDYKNGIYEIAIAPSNSNIVYAHYMGFVYRSADKCATWVKKTAITGDRHDGSNLGYQRYMANKMAVDPLDADIVYVGTMDAGLWRTLDGGATWTQLTDVPTATGVTPYYLGISAILFDPTSGSSSTPTRTSVIWAFSYDNGYYRSTDGGTTWAEPASGPTLVTNACFDVNGDLYACTDSATVFKFSSGAWSSSNCNLSSASTPACDPNDTGRVIVFGAGGGAVETTNGASSWGTVVQSSAQTRTATDIPWLAWTNESYMSAGRISFDKVTQNKILFSEGIGFWTATLAPGFTALAWTSMSLGIEELVSKQVYQPFGSRKLYCMSSDRDLFVIGNPDVYPSRHFLKYSTAAINHGSFITSAPNNPDRMAALTFYRAATSDDGGYTWTNFPTSPTFTDFSAGQWPQASTICMVTDDIWLTIAGGGRGMHRTTDAGANWTSISLPGSPAMSDFSFGYYHDRQLFTLDGVTAGTAYLWGQSAVYKSTDYGANWTSVYSGNVLGSVYYHAKLKSVPGQAGHLFLSGGHTSTGSPITDYDSPGGSFYRSTDGGVTWVRCGVLNDIREVYDFAFGPTPAGQSYPVLWIAGWVNSVFGIYYCLDASVLDASTSGTWYKVGDYPLGSLDRIITLDCDKGSSTWKRVFLGFTGMGYMYGSADAYSSEAQTLTITTS